MTDLDTSKYEPYLSTIERGAFGRVFYVYSVHAQILINIASVSGRQLSMACFSSPLSSLPLNKPRCRLSNRSELPQTPRHFTKRAPNMDNIHRAGRDYNIITGDPHNAQKATDTNLPYFLIGRQFKMENESSSQHPTTQPYNVASNASL